MYASISYTTEKTRDFSILPEGHVSVSATGIFDTNPGNLTYLNEKFL